MMQPLPYSHKWLLGITAVTLALDAVLVAVAVSVWLARGHERTWGGGAVFATALTALAVRIVYTAVLWRGTAAHRAGRGTLTDPRWHRRLALWPQVSMQLGTVVLVALVGSTLLETPEGREPWASAFWRQTSRGQRALLSGLAFVWTSQLFAGWAQSWRHHGGSHPQGVMVVGDVPRPSPIRSKPSKRMGAFGRLRDRIGTPSTENSGDQELLNANSSAGGPPATVPVDSASDP